MCSEVVNFSRMHKRRVCDEDHKTQNSRGIYTLRRCASARARNLCNWLLGFSNVACFPVGFGKRRAKETCNGVWAFWTEKCTALVLFLEVVSSLIWRRGVLDGIFGR
jgi:hypothetical protein